MKYFAYGSNMSLARLQQRVPSARRVGTYFLAKHRLLFHKAGIDGSAKCDAHWTGKARHAVAGSLFELAPEQRRLLDQAEGVGFGYEIKEVAVQDARGTIEPAFLYYATRIEPSLLPYSWYKEHVLIGAREAGLPGRYIDEIVAVESREDPDRLRDTRERAIHLLADTSL
jgi:hypothetical protein